MGCGALPTRRSLKRAKSCFVRSPFAFCLLPRGPKPIICHERAACSLLARKAPSTAAAAHEEFQVECNSRAARPAGRPGAASTRSRRHIWYCSRGPTPTAAHRRRPSQLSSAVEPRNTGVRRSFIKRSSSRRKGHRASSWLGRSRSIECLQLRRHGKLRRQSSRSRRPSCCHRLRRMSCCSSER